MRFTSVFSAATAAALAVGLALAAPAQAGTITQFSGQDDGAAVGGPFPNSFATLTAFDLAAQAFGPTEQHGFGNSGDGFHDINWAGGVGTVNYTATSPNFGVPFSGVNSTTNGNHYGFSADGNAKWLGFPGGSATFNFSGPINSLGLMFTGVEFAQFGTVISITFNDGTSHTINPTLNNNGGAQFFGFTDTSAFTSLTISSADSGDTWGIDDVTFNTPPGATPLPAALPLFASGLGGLGFLNWRRKKRKAAAIVAA